MTPSSAAEPLKECPWCVRHFPPVLHELPADKGPRKWQIMCTGCCATGPIGFTPDDARTFWNRYERAALPASGERERVLEEAAKIADAWCERNHWPNGAWGIAAEIRALASPAPAEGKCVRQP